MSANAVKNEWKALFHAWESVLADIKIDAFIYLGSWFYYPCFVYKISMLKIHWTVGTLNGVHVGYGKVSLMIPLDLLPRKKTNQRKVQF